jgi:pimeloyl-ACP methyl ester carboxylesterase
MTKSNALLIFGDADLSTPRHAAQMFALFGGGPSGDFYELTGSRLVILPGTTHTQIMERTELLIPIITKFLNK